MGLFGGCYQDGNLDDDNYLDGLILENEQEKLVPKELSLKDLIFYPISSNYKYLTIFILLATLYMSFNYFGMCLSVFILILYSIFLIRKILFIRNTWIFVDSIKLRGFVKTRN